MSRQTLLWRRLSGPPLGPAVAFACQHMIRRLEATHGPPVAQGDARVVRLWRWERFRDVALQARPWRLDDGRMLEPDDPVLEMHIASDRLLAELRQGQPWRQAITAEFRSIAPQLAARREAAIVGSTILVRQVVEFGATTRPAPPGLHTSLDTFYRKLILLTFHPGGLSRVMSHRYGLVEAAISLADFCARYGEAAADPRAGSFSDP
jgi:hypothetical protein